MNKQFIKIMCDVDIVNVKLRKLVSDVRIRHVSKKTFLSTGFKIVSSCIHTFLYVNMACNKLDCKKLQSLSKKLQ